MTTLGPTISATGISVPDFDDVQAELLNLFMGIYGVDTVTDVSTQDMQWIAVLAQAITDCNQAAVDVYNAFTLNGAQGTGLSSLVKMIGLRRQSASFSTAVVTITGTANTVINVGIVGDNQGLGTQWALPSTVTIPLSGTINVTATCTVAGATAAGANTLTQMLTPTNGWQSVNNAQAASLGAPVQQDSALRQAATNSVGGPSLTPLSAIFEAIANVANVSRFTVYENDTDVNDANGQGPHSIYAVVQGGDPVAVCTAIAVKKSPGTTTLGTTSEVIIDPSGVPDTINYYQLTLVPITVIVNVHRLAGWNANTVPLIQNAIAQYLNALPIGTTSYLNRLFAPATLNGDDATLSSGMTQAQLDAISATFNVTSIEQSRPSDAPPAVQDVPIAFNEATSVIVANITVNLS